MTEGPVLPLANVSWAMKAVTATETVGKACPSPLLPLPVTCGGWPGYDLDIASAHGYCITTKPQLLKGDAEHSEEMLSNENLTQVSII
jgi:hypothetical protein